MKLSKLSQLALVSTIGLIGATFLTACQLVTIDFVYVADSAGSSVGSAGQIQTFEVDAFSGALRLGPANVPSGGTAPVSMATTSDYNNLYVANQGNNSIVHFTVGVNGNLTQAGTVTVATTPVYIAVSPANNYLYVVSYSPAATTPTAVLTEYSLSSGTIGSVTATQPLTIPEFTSDLIIPTGVSVLSNGGAVYATAYDKSAYNPGGATSSNANPGWLFGFSIGSSGALTATASSPYQAGVKPTALTNDPTSRFVYVTDYASNELIGYSVLGSNALEFMISGPFKTGNEPSAITIDPRGIYIYLTNSLASNISAYTISLPTGNPSGIVGATSGSNYTTDTEPVAVVVEPGLGRYVFTANYLGNSISGFKLDPNNGALTSNQATPYPTGAFPTALIAVPHGNHAVQSVTP